MTDHAGIQGFAEVKINIELRADPGSYPVARSRGARRQGSALGAQVQPFLLLAVGSSWCDRTWHVTLIDRFVSAV